jgi:hypothetical protein
MTKPANPVWRKSSGNWKREKQEETGTQNWSKH